MHDDLVSIIVPVYNVEHYIETCVNSLINQTYKSIEIILIDDGSTDGCPTIIDQLAKLDQRIFVVHQKNEGVSAARNAGLEHSSGDYIMFVDGDDWVDPDYVLYFLELLNETGALIGMNKNNFSVSKTKTTEKKYTVKAEKVIEMIYLDEIFVAVWNKIYSRRLLVDNNIFFDSSIWYGEGMLFNIQCLQYVDAVAVGEKSVYHQTYNPNSAMRKFNLESNLCGIKSLEIQRKIWEKHTPAIEKAWEYHKYRFNRSIASGLLESNLVSKYPDLYNECIKNIRKNIMMPLKMEKKFKAKIGWIIYSLSPSMMAKRALRIRKKFQSGGGDLELSKIFGADYIAIHILGNCA